MSGHGGIIIIENGSFGIVDYDDFECSEYFGCNAFKFVYSNK